MEGYKKTKKKILKTIYGLYRIKKGVVLSGKQQTKQKLVKMTYVLHYYIFELEVIKRDQKLKIFKTIYGLYGIKKGGVLSGKQQTKQKLVKMKYVLHYYIFEFEDTMKYFRHDLWETKLTFQWFLPKLHLVK